MYATRMNGATMRIRTVALIALIALVIGAVGSAVAASRPGNPSRLVLRQRDVSGCTRYSSIYWNTLPRSDAARKYIEALKKVGVQARITSWTCSIPRSRPGYPGSELVSGAVDTTASIGQAKRLYHIIRHGFVGGSNLGIPEYGDQQIVRYSPNVSAAHMAVRDGKIVWQLGVAGFGLFSIDESTMTAEMMHYAYKQTNRITVCSGAHPPGIC
jgi:hypothetical protein